jgi:hypothetical protein
MPGGAGPNREAQALPSYTGTGNDPAMDTTDRENAERVKRLALPLHVGEVPV